MKDKNTTYEKLQGLPFKTASELKKAESEIDMKVWKTLTYAKATREMLSREEFNFLKEEFKAGFTCSYGEKEIELLKIYSDGPGIKIHINDDAVDGFQNPDQLRLVFKTISEVFANSYYSAMGIMTPNLDPKDPTGK